MEERQSVCVNVLEMEILWVKEQDLKWKADLKLIINNTKSSISVLLVKYKHPMLQEIAVMEQC